MKVPKARQLDSGTWFIQLRLAGVSIPVTGETEAEAAVEFLRDGKEIFGEYHDTKAAEGDTDAVEQMGLQKADCVYVGDTEVDLQTARNAGLACIAVTWGFRSEEELVAAGATRIAHSARELGEMLGE